MKWEDHASGFCHEGAPILWEFAKAFAAWILYSALFAAALALYIASRT